MNTSDFPLVTVGLPVYNGERFLAKTIESLLSMDYPNLEIIISDNASVDRTQEICRSFVSRDLRIRYQRNSMNLGPLANFQKIIDVCSGDFIMIATDHDLRHPSYVTRLMRELLSDEAIVLAYPRTVIIDEDDEIIEYAPDRIDTRGLDKVRRFSKIIWEFHWGNMNFGVYRKEALKKIVKEYHTIGCDHVQMASLSLVGYIAQVEEYLFYRRNDHPKEDSINRQKDWHIKSRIKSLAPWTMMAYEQIKVIRDSELSASEKELLFADVKNCYTNRFGPSMLGEVSELLKNGEQIIFDSNLSPNIQRDMYLELLETVEICRYFYPEISELNHIATFRSRLYADYRQTLPPEVIPFYLSRANNSFEYSTLSSPPEEDMTKLVSNIQSTDVNSNLPVQTSNNASLERLIGKGELKIYAGDIPDRPEYDGWIGFSITKCDHRHILHDITDPFPVADNSVDAFQAEDVLEHIPYDRLLPVLNEIFRVLKPNCLFRLSVPDYGCDVLQKRSEKDLSGKIVFDPEGGGTRENPGHVWFPRINNVRALIDRSLFARQGRVEYLHYFEMNGSFVVKPVDYSKGHVDRSPDFDDRVKAPYRPMSMIIDLVKTAAPSPGSATVDQKSSVVDAGAHSCAFINTYYPAFLNDIYAKAPSLSSASYQDQKSILQGQFFGDSDFYSGCLKKAGWTADDLIVNCVQLQQAWARENGFDGDGMLLAVEQIRRARPDVIYLQNLGLGTTEFLSAVRPHVGMIVGQIAYPLPGETDLSGFDIIFSSFPHFVERFRSAGITAYYQPLAFEPRVLKSLTRFPYKNRPIDCSFVGGISPEHGRGYQLLEQLAGSVPIHFWGYGAETLHPGSAISGRHHGEVWGMEMFYLLGASKITINRHIDVAENNANNMRLFEATGCGALLITDYKDNLHELFEIGKEVVVYHSPEECIELINYYLAHPEEAEVIAAAGQARTLQDHTYDKRMQQTAELLARQVRYRREKDGFVMPSRISDNYQSLRQDQISPSLEAAWKDPSIPQQQRALTQQQLEQMYRGQVASPYKILADLIRPCVDCGMRVLEIGCASGYYYEVLEYLLNKRIAYTGVDYSQAMIDMAKDYYSDASFQTADGACLPFPDSSFPLVISGCVLLHTTDYARHIAETARVAEKWIAVHRTPVCRTRPTTYYSKRAYGVETVELRFNEQELLDHFSRHGFALKRALTYEERPDHDEYEASYLLERVK